MRTLRAFTARSPPWSSIRIPSPPDSRMSICPSKVWVARAAA
ncbi:hypothetical protein [Micromonospora aurantiaca (nom. illeg.)]